MKFGICNEIFEGWEIGAVMKHAARRGYDGIELAPHTLARSVNEISNAHRLEIRDMAARLNLEICGLHWLLAHTEGLYLNHPDPTIRKKTGKYLVSLVDCCGDLGGKILVLGSPKQRNVLPGLTPEQASELAISTLNEAVLRAQEKGILLCIEPLAPNETNFINSAAEAINFIKQFNSPAIRIILDVKAMSAEAQPISEIIHRSWPHFAHFHANDINLKEPGFGETDFKPIARALKEVGYSDYVSVEVFRFDEGPEEIARRSLETLRESFAVSG